MSTAFMPVSNGVLHGDGFATSHKNALRICEDHVPEPLEPRIGNVDIIDIRQDRIEHSILDEMLAKLRPPAGATKSMPTLLLYDEEGLKLFEDITYLEQYYLTNAEIDVLSHYADEIASRIAPGSMVVELGSGYDYSTPAPL